MVNTRTANEPLEQYNSEIERSLSKLRQAHKFLQKGIDKSVERLKLADDSEGSQSSSVWDAISENPEQSKKTAEES